MDLNGDLTRRVSVDVKAMEWTASPSNTVWRKRMHRVGPPEAGQVTSIVQYQPGATFHAHAHPEGEEILVLEGVFSDDQGDWPAGTYLLNPEGFSHSPSSEPGCTLFVKLRQYPGLDRHQLALRVEDVPWKASDRAGVEVRSLYAQAGYSDTMRIERWTPGTQLDAITYVEGVEIFVLDGCFSDEHGTYDEFAWLRLPRGASHSPASESGCELYVKEGGMAYQLQGTGA